MARLWTRGFILLGVASVPLLLLGFEFKAASSGDWPQFRGQNRDGVSAEKGLLSTWTGDGPPLEWKAAGCGRGYSSVAIADGKVFTQGDRGQEGFVIAFDAEGGRELWATPFSQPWSGGGPNSTPTVDGDRVYALSCHGDLVCLDAADGSQKWKKNFAQDFGGTMMSGWGFSESVLIDGDRLICTPGGQQAVLVALDKLSGEPIWKSAMPSGQAGNGAGYSSVVISEAAGVKQYIQLIGRGLISVRAEDGTFLWGYDKIANGTANIPTPIVHGDYVFGSTGYSAGSVVLKLSRDGKGVKAKEIRFLPADELQNHHGGMVLVGNHIYGGHGHNNGFPICLEFKTGKVAWREGRGAGEGSAAVVAADGHLYFRYQDGKMALVEASPKGYREKGTFQIPDCDSPSWSLPAVAGGRLYLREQDNLLCYRLRAE